jgi:hypothetical protein
MNFDDLYKRVIITEEEDLDKPVSSTPVPDSYEVDPLPLPVANNDAQDLNKYIDDIKQFLSKLNGIEGRSLQQFVNDIDKKNSLFEGISETSRDITKLAETTAALVQTLHSYVSGMNKRKRELAIVANSR